MEPKLSKTKLIAVGLAILAVAAGYVFKVDIGKALEQFTATESAIEKTISE